MPSEIEIFHGEANPTEARIYARAASDRPGARITGSVYGPVSRYAQTLQATVPLVDRGPGPSLLAEAVVPDPCYWTPDGPYLYRVRAELTRGTTVDATQETLVGIRALGTSGPNFILAGKRWVLRGIARGHIPSESVTGEHLQACHDARAALWVVDPDESLCQQASHLGVFLVARLAAAQDDPVSQQLDRLARWPAVALAVVDPRANPPWPAGEKPANLLVATHHRAGESVKPPGWADAAVCEIADTVIFARQITGLRSPVIALRTAQPAESVAQARAECDRLQKDLAVTADLAGYIV